MVGRLFAEIPNILPKIADQKIGSRGLRTKLEGLLKIEEAKSESSFVGAMAIADLVKTTLGPKGMNLQGVVVGELEIPKEMHHSDA